MGEPVTPETIAQPLQGGRGCELEEIRMKRTTIRLAVTTGTASLLALGALQGAMSLGASAAGSHHDAGTVHVAKAAVGKVLVTASGMTLYVFGPDAHKVPKCTGSCAAVWPPLLVRNKPIAGPGVKKSLLGTVRTKAGKLQVTYDHWPLYTFVEDTAPGQAHGENVRSFGGKWSTIAATGNPLVATLSSSGHSTLSTTAGSGGGW
jgi:predicted lipoprotein with Yx(FWY)xxD motif